MSPSSAVLQEDGEEYIHKDGQIQEELLRLTAQRALGHDDELKGKGLQVVCAEQARHSKRGHGSLGIQVWRFSFLAAGGQEVAVTAGDFVANGNNSADLRICFHREGTICPNLPPGKVTKWRCVSAAGEALLPWDLSGV